LNNIESFLISIEDKDLYRPGLYETGGFKGYNSKMEIMRTNISNVVSDDGLFSVSDFEINITDSTISRLFGRQYSALIFSIQNDQMITIKNSIIKETVS